MKFEFINQATVRVTKGVLWWKRIAMLTSTLDVGSCTTVGCYSYHRMWTFVSTGRHVGKLLDHKIDRAWARVRGRMEWERATELPEARLLRDGNTDAATPHDTVRSRPFMASDDPTRTT